MKNYVIPFVCLLVLGGCKNGSTNQSVNLQDSAVESKSTPLLKKFGGEYEGYITITTKNGVVKLLPIWASLNKSETSDSVTGTYFYRKVGKGISLNGMLSSDTLKMTEISAGKVTGIFSGTDYKDSVVGEWKASSESKGYPFVLYSAKPENKPYAKFVSEKLLVTECEYIDSTMPLKTLLAGSPKNSEFGNYESEGELSYLFCRNNVLAATVMKSYTTADVTFNLMFDLKSGHQLIIKNEIDPAKMAQFETLLKSKIQQKLTEEKKTIDVYDDNFITAISGSIGDIEDLSNQQIIDKAFIVGDVSGFNEYSLNGKGLNLTISGYFGLPRYTQCYDIYLDIIVPFSELNAYLKQSSPLMNVAM